MPSPRIEQELEDRYLLLYRKPRAQLQKHDIRKVDNNLEALKFYPMKSKRRLYTEAAAFMPQSSAVIRGRVSHPEHGIPIHVGYAAVPRGHEGMASPSRYQSYIERAANLDTPNGPASGLDGFANLDEAPGYMPGARRHGAVRPARFAQVYNEAGSIEIAEGRPVSFGNLGDNPEERDQYWRLSDLADRQNGIVQHRLIVEFACEATPQDRRWALEELCRRLFEENGLRYWAVMHAPDGHNDARNYHAHIVYSSRPAAKMLGGVVVPDNTPGAQWDFAITKYYTDKNWHVRVALPYRQNKLRKIDERAHTTWRDGKVVKVPGWLRTVRKVAAEVNNTILLRAGVSPKTKRYTHMGYEELGIDKIGAPHLGAKLSKQESEGRVTTKGRDAVKYHVDYRVRQYAPEAYAGLMTTAAEFKQVDRYVEQVDERFEPGVRPGAIARLLKAKEAYHNTLTALMLAVADHEAEETLEARKLKFLDGRLMALRAEQKQDARIRKKIAKFEAEREAALPRADVSAVRVAAAAVLPRLRDQAVAHRKAFLEALSAADRFVLEMAATAAQPKLQDETPRAPDIMDRISARLIVEEPRDRFQRALDKAERTDDVNYVRGPRLRELNAIAARELGEPIVQAAAASTPQLRDRISERMARAEILYDRLPIVETSASPEPGPSRVGLSPSAVDLATPAPLPTPESAPTGNAVAFGLTQRPVINQDVPPAADPVYRPPVQPDYVDPVTKASTATAPATLEPLPSPIAPAPVAPTVAALTAVAPAPSTDAAPPAAPAASEAPPVVAPAPSAAGPVVSASTPTAPAPQVQAAPAQNAPIQGTPAVTAPVPTAAQLEAERQRALMAEAAKVVLARAASAQASRRPRFDAGILAGAEIAAGSNVSANAHRDEIVRYASMDRDEFLARFVKTQGARRALNAVQPMHPTFNLNKTILLERMDQALRTMEQAMPLQALRVSPTGVVEDHVSTDNELDQHLLKLGFRGGRINAKVNRLWLTFVSRGERIEERRRAIERDINRTIAKLRPQRER